MGRKRKKKESVLDSPEFDELLEQTKDVLPEEAEHLTVYCPGCDYDLWRVSKPDLEASVSSRAGSGLDISSLEALQPAKKPSTTLPLFCFLCGTQVFTNRYYGGFEVLTRENGKYPHGNVRGPGIRIPNPTGFPRR